jgi:hypothetical protein
MGGAMSDLNPIVDPGMGGDFPQATGLEEGGRSHPPFLSFCFRQFPKAVFLHKSG